MSNSVTFVVGFDNTADYIVSNYGTAQAAINAAINALPASGTSD